MRLENGQAMLERLEAESFEFLTGEKFPLEGLPPGQLKAKIAKAYEQRMSTEPGKRMLWNVAKGMLGDLDRMAALN